MRERSTGRGVGVRHGATHLGERLMHQVLVEVQSDAALLLVRQRVGDEPVDVIPVMHRVHVRHARPAIAVVQRVCRGHKVASECPAVDERLFQHVKFRHGEAVVGRPRTGVCLVVYKGGGSCLWWC